MSILVFPDTLMGIDIAVARSVIYATKIQTASSGKELRASFQSTPRYAYELTLNFLRQSGFSVNTLLDEAAALSAFYVTHRGQWDSFLYNDPVDGVQRRVRFAQDNLDLKRIVNLCWDGGTIKLISVK